ncbi:hypothetical protein HD806DRAFT_545131 [Xylariaceae sp. AK1471]|nr:hypothetical protein HD806DRAFT_545131 [Xylariaceae sp. AK1471]
MSQWQQGWNQNPQHPYNQGYYQPQQRPNQQYYDQPNPHQPYSHQYQPQPSSYQPYPSQYWAQSFPPFPHLIPPPLPPPPVVGPETLPFGVPRHHLKLNLMTQIGDVVLEIERLVAGQLGIVPLWGLRWFHVEKENGKWRAEHPKVFHGRESLPILAFGVDIVLPVTYHNFYELEAQGRREERKRIRELAKNIHRDTAEKIRATRKYIGWLRKFPSVPYYSSPPDVLYPLGMAALAINISIGLENQVPSGSEWEWQWVPGDWVFQPMKQVDKPSITEIYSIAYWPKFKGYSPVPGRWY